MNQKALAVISFGTTYTLAQDAIMQIESTLSCHVKEYDCFLRIYLQNGNCKIKTRARAIRAYSRGIDGTIVSKGI